MPSSSTAEALCGGRRHVGWGEAPPSVEGDARGRWFASAAANEAASVMSFRALARELAPTTLGRQFGHRLRQAARQEISHARLMRAHARRHGATPIARPFQLTRPRPLLDIALENAREGCVNETYAALVAVHQAEHARDAELREAFQKVAIDETAHADLAWRLHGAFLMALEPHEAKQLEEVLDQALEELIRRDSRTAPELEDLGLASASGERHLRGQLSLALRERPRGF